MFKRNSAPDYQAELPWKYPDRPVLKAWHRWAIPHSNLHTGGFFLFFFLVCLGLGIFFYSAFLGEGKPLFQWKAMLVSSIPPALLLSVFCAMLFENRIYVYRCTVEGLEVCSWKEGYKKAIFVIKATAVLGAIALIFTAVHTNQPGIFLLAFVGPGGLALMSVSMMGSKDYIKHQRSFVHEERNWSDKVRRILIDKNRAIISLEKVIYWQDENLTTIGAFPIFCEKGQFEELILFIKAIYPDLPCKEQMARIDSFDSYEGKPQEDFNYGTHPTRSNK